MATARRTSLGGAQEVALALSAAPNAGHELLEISAVTRSFLKRANGQGGNRSCKPTMVISELL